MYNKLKTLDFIIASGIFLLAVLEFISWRLMETENYTGLVIASNYCLDLYPKLNTLGFLIVAIGKVAMSHRFKACVYTKIVAWLFLLIQLLNLSSLLIKFGSNVYSDIIYPIFLFSIIFIIFLKFLRWGSQRRS